MPRIGIDLGGTKIEGIVLERDDRIGVLTYGKEMTLLERMLLKSLRDNAEVRAAARDLAAGWTGVPELAGLPIPTLLEALREDGTLARIALMDGRPVAMADCWIKVE